MTLPARVQRVLARAHRVMLAKRWPRRIANFASR